MGAWRSLIARTPWGFFGGSLGFKFLEMWGWLPGCWSSTKHLGLNPRFSSNLCPAIQPLQPLQDLVECSGGWIHRLRNISFGHGHYSTIHNHSKVWGTHGYPMTWYDLIWLDQSNLNSPRHTRTSQYAQSCSTTQLASLETCHLSMPGHTFQSVHTTLRMWPMMILSLGPYFLVQQGSLRGCTTNNQDHHDQHDQHHRRRRRHRRLRRLRRRHHHSFNYIGMAWPENLYPPVI